MSSKAERNRRKQQQRRALANRPTSTIENPGVTQTIAQGMLVSASSSTTYQGPIPPPSLLEEYERIEQGRAAKILQLAEDQSRHRMSLENRVIWNDIWRSWAGLVVGAIFAVGSTVGGCVLVYFNHDTAGATIATVGVSGVVGSFIYGTRSQRQERTAKANALAKRRK